MLRKSIIAMLSKLLSGPIILALALMLFSRGGEGASGLPSSHSGLSYGLLYLRQFLLGFSLYKYAFAMLYARAEALLNNSAQDEFN
ncbi:hypothetical protein [Sphingorhabdus sp. YGSMI21]|uniref:hypothetical protein n=1 Tax=Sphingorhabdus sp. YGSMI21 TaxID=2077182 RepID=UPI0013DD31B2|nr:hypothetical protein [Sphingorhabdus sp. YGSMI21]